MNSSPQRAWFFISVACSLAHVFFISLEMSNLVYLTKPLCLIFIIQIFIHEEDSTSNHKIKPLFLMGLCFSLVGDIVLMFPQQFFLHGILFFLCAQCCYSITFFRLIPWKKQDLIYAILPALYLLGLLTILLPNIGKFAIAIVIYGAIISTMFWRALCCLSLRRIEAYLLAFGAFLFVASDSCIAINKFVVAFPSAKVAIMTTYLAAQILLTYSTIVLSRTKSS